METQLPQLSNPRNEAIIEDWPIGWKRCRAHFVVESRQGYGERISRRTENKMRTGWNAPKISTYAQKYVICDGADGQTYLVCKNIYRTIEVWYGTLLHACSFPDNHPQYEQYNQLLS